MVVDKIKTAALEAIEKQEDVVGHVIEWELLNARDHKLRALVRVGTTGPFEPFNVWVTVDLDTEETIVV